MAVTKLDLTGLKCPLPVLMTRKALRALAVGDRLEVRCTDPLAAIDIPVAIQQSGDHLAASARSDAAITFMIEKRNAAIANDD